MRDERAIGDSPDESRGHPHRAGSCGGKWDEREQVVVEGAAMCSLGPDCNERERARTCACLWNREL
jgi:hypothetical protein